MNRSIQLLEEKCKSTHAIYQIRSKPIRSVPNCSIPTIRFSGTPDTDLNHILEVLEVGNRVVVMVFSAALRYADDFAVLAEEVDSINKEAEHGAWIFEEAPSLKQFCFMVWVHVDRCKNEAQITELLWKTILYADSCYKQQAKRLMRLVVKTTKILPSGKINAFFSTTILNNILSRLEENFQKVNFEALEKAVRFEFEGKFKDGKLVDDFKAFKGVVTMGFEVCHLVIYFCYKSQPAEFTTRHRISSLLDRINKFNLVLGVGQFIFNSELKTVSFRYSFYWRDFHTLQLPLSIRGMLSSFPATLPKYFEHLQKYYLNPVEDIAKPRADDIEEIVESYHGNVFPEEAKEVERLWRSKAGKYLIKSHYRMEPNSYTIRYYIPRGYLSLSNLLASACVPTHSVLQALVDALKDLRASKAYYTHIADIIFVTSESANRLVEVIPMTLLKNKARENTITDVMASINKKMLEHDRFMMENYTISGLIAGVSQFDLIEKEAIKMDRRTQGWTLGVSPVDLLPLENVSSNRDIHQLLYRIQIHRKLKHSNQPTIYGLTVKAADLFLVVEAVSNLQSLRDAIGTGEITAELSKELIQEVKNTVEYCEVVGLEVGNMRLEDIRIRRSKGKLLPLFPVSLHFFESQPSYNNPVAHIRLAFPDAETQHSDYSLRDSEDLSYLLSRLEEFVSPFNSSSTLIL